MKHIKLRLPDLASLKRFFSDEFDEGGMPADADEVEAFTAAGNVFEAPRYRAPARMEPFPVLDDDDDEAPMFDAPTTANADIPLEEIDLEIDPELEAVITELADEVAPSEAVALDALQPAVAAAPEADPDDILSFFESSEQKSLTPDALKDGIATISAAELLGEAEELRALLYGGSGRSAA